MSQDSVVFNGFTVIPVKITKQSKCNHYFYVKEHNVRGASTTKPMDKTLFVLNIPQYCEKKHLEYLFSNAGFGEVTDVFIHSKPMSGEEKVETSKFFPAEPPVKKHLEYLFSNAGFGEVTDVFIHSKPMSGEEKVETSKFFPAEPPVKGYKVAYVVFEDSTAIKKAKSWPYDKPLVLQSQGAPPLRTGMKKWCKEYEKDTVNINELQTEVDEYMAEFDKKMEEEERKAKEQEGVPDEDGWVKVTKFSKNRAPRTEAHERHLTEKEKKKRKDKELINFYKFQIRESKRQNIADLRKKFEEDKQRIALMKASRKFRPY